LTIYETNALKTFVARERTVDLGGNKVQGTRASEKKKWERRRKSELDCVERESGPKNAVQRL